MVYTVNEYKMIEHNLINNEIYAVVDKDVINKKRELREKNSPGSSCYVENVYDEVEADYSKQDSECLYDEVEADFSKVDDAGRTIPADECGCPKGLMETRNSDDRHSSSHLQKSYSTDHRLNDSSLMDEPTVYSHSFQRNSVSTENILDYNGEVANNMNRYREKMNSYSQQYMNCYNDDYDDNLQSRYHKDRSISTDCLTKSLNDVNLRQLREFKKQHRRMRSHESFEKTFMKPINDVDDDNYDDNTHHSNHLQSRNSDYGVYSLSNSTLEDDNSEEDLGRLLSSREGAHDILINNDEVAELFQNSKELENDGLPEGWQEVKEGAETYYWHIWTGTIQYERPAGSATPNSSSRSISPFSGNSSSHSSRTPSLSEAYEERNVKSSNIASNLETSEKAKQVISFPVHSMGWMNVDEGLMAPEIIGDTVNKCIASLAEKRQDLWNVTETWANGEDMKLVLEGESLKLVEAKTKKVLHIQPIAKMRVWGVGRVETRDFAYIARDQTTGKHKCHMFRCHGHLSARSITNALHAICNRVLDEKRKAKERCESPMYNNRSAPSDLMKPPMKSGNAFNEKPYTEQKKCFTAKYVGSAEVSKSSGIDIINRTVSKLTDGKQVTDWSSVLLEVTTSEIRTIDCAKQETTLEHRVRFVSFLGVAHDERFGAYIVAVGKDSFMCNVFFCAPHAGTLTKAIEEACKLRFEKMLDGKLMSKKSAENQPVPQAPPPPTEPECIVAQPVFNPTAQIGHSPTPVPPAPKGMREKTKGLTSSIAGVFNKLNKRDTKKKDEEANISACIPGPNEHLVKYFGSVAVDIGTGVDTVQKAVDDLAGGEMMIGYIEILSDCVSLSDSQRTALSKRFFDFNTISYCGMTSDRRHFGIIISRGKGKYICHVFEEYKVICGEIVSAIHEVL